jgi:threonine/homoserine/homoserine lactone efflux protein
MVFLAFLAQTALISLSGVMAPGPLTAVVIGKGSESPHAGALIAAGHAIVEVPLMGAMLFGLGRLFESVPFRAALAAVGGVLLLIMSIDMFRNIKRSAVHATSYARTPLVAGMLLSIGNPYFLIWWATVGVTLLSKSTQFGLLGFAAMAVVHELCDLTWCYFLSALSFKGGQFFGNVFQKAVFAVCAALLLVFSANFLFDAASAIF